MELWFKKDSKLYEEVKKQIGLNYPTLHLVIENNSLFIRGSLVLDEPVTQREMDRFSVEIEFPHDYPKGIPLVRELDGRIPKIGERHFNINGTACMFFRDARYIHYPKGMTIVEFIEKLVKNFFIWQIDYDLNHGDSTMAEWGHNRIGVFQFYFEMLNTNNSKVVIKFLKYHTSKHVRLHWPCYCGSGKQIRFCHMEDMKKWKSALLRTDTKISLKMVA